MNDVVAIVASWVLTTSAVFLVLRLDALRMTDEQRARAWPDTSRVSAAVVFGIVCLPIHFARTRRSALGALAGVALMVLVGVLASIPDLALELGVVDLATAGVIEAILATLVAFTLLYVHVRHRWQPLVRRSWRRLTST